jgi:hypothetical protein
MTNDSKLGLLAGVAAVVLIAVVYYQKGAGTLSADPPKYESGRVTIAPPQMAANTPAVGK